MSGIRSSFLLLLLSLSSLSSSGTHHISEQGQNSQSVPARNGEAVASPQAVHAEIRPPRRRRGGQPAHGPDHGRERGPPPAPDEPLVCAARQQHHQVVSQLRFSNYTGHANKTQICSAIRFKKKNKPYVALSKNQTLGSAAFCPTRTWCSRLPARCSSSSRLLRPRSSPGTTVPVRVRTGRGSWNSKGCGCVGGWVFKLTSHTHILPPPPPAPALRCPALPARPPFQMPWALTPTRRRKATAPRLAFFFGFFLLFRVEITLGFCMLAPATAS